MADIAELERRITHAMARISAGVERLAATAAPALTPAPTPAMDEDDEVERLRAALQEERMTNAQLTERLKSLHATQDADQAALRAEVDALSRQLDAAGLDTTRLRGSVVQMREDLRRLREAAEQGMADPQLINKAMLAELEALRATRAAETHEMQDIMAALGAVVDAEEARAHA